MQKFGTDRNARKDYIIIILLTIALPRSKMPELVCIVPMKLKTKENEVITWKLFLQSINCLKFQALANPDLKETDSRILNQLF